MKFTLSWLLEYLDTDASVDEITNTLTYIGLEVENIIQHERQEGFIIAQLLQIIPHPLTNQLHLCQVYDGTHTLQIVCGAHNLREGVNIVLASLGTVLPKRNCKVEKKEICGSVSEGIICSEYELGRSNTYSDEIIIISDQYKVGTSFFYYETCIDVNITPNRGDCLGIYGIARDLAAAGIGTLKTLNIPDLIPSIESPINLKVHDIDNIMIGIYMNNISNKETPQWLSTKLASIGMNTTNAIVDIMHYIMISFNLPIHVFDADKLHSTLAIKKANHGDSCLALNGTEYLLNEKIDIYSDDLNIHGIAGIICGTYSACTFQTINILFIVPIINPLSIMYSSRTLNLHTEYSCRLSRSIDHNFVLSGLKLATKMVLDICGGLNSFIISDGILTRQEMNINVSYEHIRQLGNISITLHKIHDIFNKLGFIITNQERDFWNIIVPSWRQDITLPIDLIEEVVRIYGVNNIKEQSILETSVSSWDNTDDLRVLMVSRGFYEVLTWSFMSDIIAKKFGYHNKKFMITHPFNYNYTIMRPTIIPNLLQVIKENLSTGISDLAIFEIGPIYNTHNLSLNYDIDVLSGVRTGMNIPRNHYYDNREVDLFDVKADLISALEIFNIDCEDITICRIAKEDIKQVYYHTGRSGTVSFANTIIGYFGEIHPKVLSMFEVRQKIVGFELILQNIKDLPIKKKAFIDYKFQHVKRDFAFIVNNDVAVDTLVQIVRHSSELIVETSVFDIYHGENSDLNKMSIGLSVTLCSPTHTLNEEEIQKASNIIIQLISQNVGGILRYESSTKKG
ncbi:phenylalanine--tRNA ligase subunit beta [Wolbachia endosymbiont of Howardula sp.]|uniref:phenylalanine--tRNA ligase subunit beta n=1 Tax=Wolbachia endosymbiont of Howardula sp. TaxID=2916816 RepID=UPI00217CE18E|nr:phenylalanine--tRNA ligase subunit beta [Wolbachia endosymbiont of Howardula sp.]UWI83367.1 phenylalanine--tRNA ligase subunit beta [Wolbachia endosymbiont of Howardula sp.]